MTTQKGFTFIEELLIVFAIFSVLVGIVALFVNQAQTPLTPAQLHEKLYTDCLNNVQYHQDQAREIVDACNQIK